MIKTFRGLLGNGAQERIRLQHIDGKTGYRIRFFGVMANLPGTQSFEGVTKVYSIKQTVIDGVVDFSEQTLLGASFYRENATSTAPLSQVLIFDRVTFNQDIFITHKDVSEHGLNLPINYYMELETISLDDIEATAVILKNFRNTNTV
jgi:hypothetical protein